jgi:hypothetical protein
MRRRNRRDFWSGLMFIALGIGFAWQAGNYQIGTAARMGPGYFPLCLGIILALMGSIVLLGSLTNKAEITHIDKFDRRIVFLVLGSVVLHGFLLTKLGMFLSVFILVMVSSLASHEFGWKAALANAIFLVALVYLVFMKGLGLIFPLWPSFFK